MQFRLIALLHLQLSAVLFLGGEPGTRQVSCQVIQVLGPHSFQVIGPHNRHLGLRSAVTDNASHYPSQPRLGSLAHASLSGLLHQAHQCIPVSELRRFPRKYHQQRLTRLYLHGVWVAAALKAHSKDLLQDLRLMTS